MTSVRTRSQVTYDDLKPIHEEELEDATAVAARSVGELDAVLRRPKADAQAALEHPWMALVVVRLSCCRLQNQSLRSCGGWILVIGYRSFALPVSGSGKFWALADGISAAFLPLS